MRFVLLNKDRDGYLYLRIQKKCGVNIRVKTLLWVSATTWKKHSKTDVWKTLCSRNEDVRDLDAKMGEVIAEVENVLDDVNTNDDKDKITDAIKRVFEKEKQEKKKEQDRQQEIELRRILEQHERLEAERKAMEEAREKQICVFVEKFIIGISNGSILANGAYYRENTIKNWKSFLIHVFNFCNAYNLTTATFDDINRKFYDSFVSYLAGLGMGSRTINKYIIDFRRICRYASETEVNKNPTSLMIWKEKRVVEDDVRNDEYLKPDEIDAIYDYPFTGVLEQTRDIFVLGCLCSQRLSDYKKLNRSNFHETENGTPVIELTQIKTGNKVVLPILDSRIYDICEKYDYTLPTIRDRVFNDYLKEVTKQVASVCPSLMEERIVELTLPDRNKEDTYRRYLEIGEENLKSDDRRRFKQYKVYADEHDGSPLYKRNADGKVLKHRWELIFSHTARRSGATNMYRSQKYDIRDIMAVTGHQSQKICEHYIKVSASEHADRIFAKNENRE